VPARLNYSDNGEVLFLGYISTSRSPVRSRHRVNKLRALLITAMLSILSILSIARADPLVLAVDNIVKDYFSDLLPIVETAVERAGYQVRIDLLPSKRSSKLMQANLIDGQALRVEGYTNLVTNAVKVDVPIRTLVLYAIVSTDSTLYENSQLYGKSMGVSLGTNVQELIAAKYAAHVVNLKTLETAVRMINEQRLDFTAVTYEIGQQAINSGEKLRMLEEPIYSAKSYIWLAEKNTDKVPAIEKALLEMIDEGFFTP
jgi:hypothetical protein